jgi:hypothetical protein
MSLGETAVGTLDFIGGCRSIDAKDFVIVLGLQFRFSRHGANPAGEKSSAAFDAVVTPKALKETV